MGNISNDPAALWFRGYRKVQSPRLRLVCFAHAGGTASVFRSWHNGLPHDVEVLGVHYPGRQDRLLEDPIEHLDVLADAITDALAPYRGGPLAFFGHSMGASVAHEVAARLEERHDHRITRLFVSARRAPHDLLADETYLRTDDGLVEELHRLGDADTVIADHPEMRELILPALRADFALVANYRPESVRVIAAPIDALIGTEDPDMSAEDMLGWADVTKSAFSCRTFPGDHFYLKQRENELLGFIAQRLRGAIDQAN